MKRIFFILFLLILQTSCLASSLTDEALLHLNKPYIYATAGPDSFDCSGLTFYCSKKAYHKTLKRTAYEQGYDDFYEKIVNIEDLQRGDLVYFNTNLKDNDLCDHAGIYLMNGNFIHASSSDEKVVISNLLTGYYNKRFSWGRRIIKGEFYEKPFYSTKQEK